jgi:hypothetical protein
MGLIPQIPRMRSSSSKQPVPGPGTYFEGYKDFSSAAKPEYLQFFGSTSTRFDPTAQRETMCVPGPGTYYSPPTFTAKPRSMRRKGNSAPFSTKKERFDYNNPGKKDEYLAAPGSYNMPLAMADTLNKVVRPLLIEPWDWSAVLIGLEDVVVEPGTNVWQHDQAVRFLIDPCRDWSDRVAARARDAAGAG